MHPTRRWPRCGIRRDSNRRDYARGRGSGGSWDRHGTGVRQDPASCADGAFHLGEKITATPALVDGMVYVRTEKNLYAFGAMDSQ